MSVSIHFLHSLGLNTVWKHYLNRKQLPFSHDFFISIRVQYKLQREVFRQTKFRISITHFNRLGYKTVWLIFLSFPFYFPFTFIISPSVTLQNLLFMSESLYKHKGLKSFRGGPEPLLESFCRDRHTGSRAPSLGPTPTLPKRKKLRAAKKPSHTTGKYVGNQIQGVLNHRVRALSIHLRL